MEEFVSKYASEASYDGQKASIGRVVVVKRSALAAGVIDGFCDPEQTSVVIKTLDGDRYDDLEFRTTRTQHEVEHMPDRSWTWPVRV